MGKDRLIVLNRERSKLPYELPPNLVYWIKCETRSKPGGPTNLISDQELTQFYNTRVTLRDGFNSS